MADYKQGDQLDLVGGIYKRYRHATFLHKAGTKMCYVKVHGDSASERSVRLTSVRKAVATTTKGATTTTKSDNDTIVMSKEEYKELLDEINALLTALANLEVKARRYG
jgi:PHD/YefM family antitoxin component YafN of YafNO toxin-antitoxin module